MTRLLSKAGRRTLVIGAAALLVAGLFSACSSSKGGASGAASTVSASASPAASGDVVAQVQAILTKAAGPSVFQDPGPAVDASKVAGKKVFMLASTTQLPFVQQLIAGVKDAGKTADLSITVGDAQNQATEMSRLLQQAVSSKYDAIILFGGDPNSLSGPLKAAKAADIPVILAFNGDPSVPTAQQMSDWNTVANGTYCYSCAAALVADYAIVSTGAKVNAMMTWDPTALSSTDLKKGFQNELAKWCPKTCSASYVNTPGATAFADTGSATQAAVQKQTVNFIFPQYDGYIEAVLPAIKSGQAENRIAVGSDNADLAQMQEMAAGGPVKVDIGSPVAWSGWAIVDQVLRALTGMAASPDEHLPLRVFDAANVKDFDLSADPGTWYGPVDYRASYEKLWGLS